LSIQNRAELLLADGEPDVAKEWAETALKNGRGLNDRFSNGLAHLALGRAEMALDNHNAAEKSLNHAFQSFELESPHFTGIVKMEMGELKKRQGDSAEAERLFAEARETFVELGAMRQLAPLDPDHVS